MIKKLNNIRQGVYDISTARKIVNTLLILLLGIVLGIFSKFLDCIPSNKLPYLVEMIDLSNFFGRTAIWYLLAVIISTYSKTPIRAAINVFVFFAGMLAGYYVYTRLFAMFWPDMSYFILWAVLTALSPVLAFVCYYAKGKGKTAFIISSFIVAVFFLQAFNFSLTYFDMAYQGLEIVVWIIGIAVLYKSPKQLAAMIGLSLIFAVILRILFPIGFFI